MIGYRSPEGTWEPVRKSVLEDFTLPCAAFRLLAYLATKPASWVINEEHLIRVTGWPANRVRQGLRDLRKRGYFDEAVERKPSGTIVRREWTLPRDLVVSAGHDLDARNLDASKPDSSHDQAEYEKPQVGTPMHSSLKQAQLAASKSSAIEKTESFSEDGVSSEDGKPTDPLRGSAADGEIVDGEIVEEPARNTATLLAEWIDHCTTRPPTSQIGQMAKKLKKLLDVDKIPYDMVRAGLAAWFKSDATVGSLDHFVSVEVRGGRNQRRPGGNRHQQNDAAAEAYLAAVDEYESRTQKEAISS